MEMAALPKTMQELRQKVAYAEQVKRITDAIHAAKDLEQILVDLKEEILGLFDAEQLTLYAVDSERRELYTQYLDLVGVQEIRVPINEQSIAGYAARYRKTINLADAYDEAELRRVDPAITFDRSWDRGSIFRTRQVLTLPIVVENRYLMGVVQLVNKKSGGRFTKEDEESVGEISKTLGIAFYNHLKLVRKKKVLTKFDDLISRGLITRSELNAAITHARERRKDVESILMEQYNPHPLYWGAFICQGDTSPL